MVRVLIPSGALGLNYDKQALERGLAALPDIIAIDGGSTDSGPAYLGQGVSKYSRASTKVEWQGLMQARAKADIPLVIGTAGTCGSDSAVDWLLQITKDIADDLGQRVKIAVLRSSQDPEYLKAALAAGRITPLSPAPDINDSVLDSCSNIVALAGAEQIQMALNTGADIIIAGRTTDTATIAALPLMRGCHAGAAWHGAKIGECGAISTSHPMSGVILIEFDTLGFTITPMEPEAKATPYTTSAHMLYENSDPFVLYEPGGHLDVTAADYQPHGTQSVRVTGAQWVASDRYTVKLEGARPAGFQSVLLVLLRDRRYVENAQLWADDIQKQCSAKVQDRMGLPPDDFCIELRLIGQNASFGALETVKTIPVEIGVMAIVTAATQAGAQEIAKMLNPYLLHHPLVPDEPMPTFAFPFSPADMDRGQIYEFCLNHVLELSDPMDVFRLEVIDHG